MATTLNMRHIPEFPVQRGSSPKTFCPVVGGWLELPLEKMGGGAAQKVLQARCQGAGEGGPWRALDDSAAADDIGMVGLVWGVIQ